ncbi:MAG: type II secretion system protein, partial [Gemmatimonadota bacterium]
MDLHAVRQVAVALQLAIVVGDLLLPPRDMNASRLAVPVPRRRDCRGFTLLELLAVMAIIGVLSAIAVPRIRTAIDQARVAKAIGDIKNMQTDLQAIEASGQPLPATLAGIGRAGLLDPWGNPYVYVVFPPGP